jgi:preprotein translocase subunit SecG
MFYFFLAVEILVCIALIVAVLLQAGTGGGLAAMGGGASTDSFLGGRQAATILTKASWWLGGTFLGLALILAGLSTRTSQPRSVLEAEPVAPTPVLPSPDLPITVEPQPEQGTQETPPPQN